MDQQSICISQYKAYPAESLNSCDIIKTKQFHGLTVDLIEPEEDSVN